ncbi:MAG: FecR domain-containing protein [Bacteroidota bacterium]|nr:FecR domain-containing protein [Bacteroidota bacterium]
MKEDLIIKYLVGEAEPHEIIMMDDWRKSDPENERQFQSFKTIWDESIHVKNEEEFNTDKAWQKIKHQLNEKPATKVISFKRQWLVAASVVVILSIVGLIYQSQKQGLYVSAFYTSEKDIQKINLEDGSKVTLNNGSFRFSQSKFSNKRIVKLDSGKAFFNVAANKNKPFIISTHDVSITVVGTSFEVESQYNFTSVKVIEGTVIFTTPVGKQTLTAGMGALYDQNKSTLSALNIKTSNELSYHTGTLQFNNQRLEDVISDLNKFQNHYEIIIENADIKDCLLTSTFKNEKLEDIIQVITATLQFSYQKDEDNHTIIIKGNHCK